MRDVNKPIKVLQMNAGSKNFGGVASFLINIYKHINTEYFQFDFLSPDITTYESVRDEIELRGGHIYELHCGDGVMKRINLILRLRVFLRENKYDIVHINSGSPGFNTISLLTVKLSCSSKVIVHSHNTITNISKGRAFFYNICALILNKKADLRLACSNVAGKFMFGNGGDFQVINNGIELGKFKYNKTVRERIRNDIFNLVPCNKVIGFVGRLEDQKNPDFAISVFNEILKLRPNWFLWIIGNGRLKEEIESLIDKYGIKNRALILGERKNVADLMQAMDALLLPSKFEGLGIVAIEAQSCGLRVYASDVLPEESKINNCIKYVSLKLSQKEWAKLIINDMETNTDSQRLVPQAHEFDINEVCKMLQKSYSFIVGE